MRSGEYSLWKSYMETRQHLTSAGGYSLPFSTDPAKISSVRAVVLLSLISMEMSTEAVIVEQHQHLSLDNITVLPVISEAFK